MQQGVADSFLLWNNLSLEYRSCYFHWSCRFYFHLFEMRNHFQMSRLNQAYVYEWLVLNYFFVLLEELLLYHLYHEYLTNLVFFWVVNPLQKCLIFVCLLFVLLLNLVKGSQYHILVYLPVRYQRLKQQLVYPLQVKQKLT